MVSRIIRRLAVFILLSTLLTSVIPPVASAAKAPSPELHTADFIAPAPQGSASLTAALLPQISAGYDYNCVVNSTGRLSCWGSNGYDRATPPSDLGAISQVSAGGEHACAITSANVLRCWGYNPYGQATVPSDLGTVIQVSAGDSHTCAITSANVLRCWGYSPYGETTVPSDLGLASQVSVGYGYSCAITSANLLRCWGNNVYGQATVPSDLGAVSQVSAKGDHTCAITSANTLRCWGSNTYGQTTVPNDLGALSQVSVGGTHSCVITAANALRCWGQNTYGQAAIPRDVGAVNKINAEGEHACAITADTDMLHCWGYNGYGEATVPDDLGTVSSVSVGGLHTCVITTTNALRCWGYNDYGQVTLPNDLGTVIQVSAGNWYTCAITSANVARCWGYNADGQATVPNDLGQVRQISAGQIHTCAITITNTLRCWGNNSVGESSVPNDLGTVSQVSVGDTYTCAITSSGTLRCWGGTISNGGQKVPNDLGLVSQVSAGSSHACAITTTHALRCWGGNLYGQATVPGDLGAVSQVSVGNSYTCAVTSANIPRCWGYNDYGQATVPSDPLGSGLISGDCAHFVADVSFPDGAAVAPGQTFTKRWQLQNCGTTAWDSGYQAVRIGGAYGPDSFSVSGASGASVELAAAVTAPSTLGTYRASYKLQGPDGQFGDAFWVEVIVSETFSISGRVALSNGTGIAGVTISVSPGATVTTNQNGAYTITGLKQGYYDVSPSMAHMDFTPFLSGVIVPRYDPLNFQVDTIDTTFRPNPYGYHFSNNDQWWLSSLVVPDYSATQAVQIFGREAICINSTGYCLPTSQAQQHINSMYLELLKGHCIGMSTTSLRFFGGLDSFSIFGDNTSKYTYDLGMTGSIASHISTYQIVGILPDVNNQIQASQQQPLSNIVDQLAQALRSTSPQEHVVLFLDNPQQKIGHAVVPYALWDLGNQRFVVRVYDSNHPNDIDRQIEINTQNNSWKYDTTVDGVWSNVNNPDSLGILPISAMTIPRPATQSCAWCSNSQHLSSLPYGETHLFGGGHLLISNDQGQHIGYNGSEFVNNIPDARSSMGFGDFSAAAEPTYYLPLSQPYHMLLDGQTLSGSSTASLFQFGPGYAVSLDGIPLTPSTRDLVEVAPDGSNVTFIASESKVVTITMALDVSDDNYGFRLSDIDLTAGQRVKINKETSGDQLSFANNNTMNSSYSLQLRRLRSGKEFIFLYLDISIGAGDTHYIDYSSWDGYGEILLGIDHGSNGSIDEIRHLDNQSAPDRSNIYLPLLRSMN